MKKESKTAKRIQQQYFVYFDERNKKKIFFFSLQVFDTGRVIVDSGKTRQNQKQNNKKKKIKIFN